jgi:hypothetical protein
MDALAQEEMWSMDRDLAPTDASRIVRSGWLYKKGALVQNWKRRYFVLRESKTLAYFEGNDGGPMAVKNAQGDFLPDSGTVR